MLFLLLGSQMKKKPVDSSCPFLTGQGQLSPGKHLSLRFPGRITPFVVGCPVPVGKMMAALNAWLQVCLDAGIGFRQSSV